MSATDRDQRPSSLAIALGNEQWAESAYLKTTGYFFSSPNSIHQPCTVCVCENSPLLRAQSKALCVNVEMQNETVTSVMCSLASPSIRLTFTLCFSTLASPLSNTGLHYFWMEVGVCVHVCLWEREREKRCVYESLCAEMPAAVIDLWILSAQITSLFSQGRS